MLKLEIAVKVFRALLLDASATSCAYPLNFNEERERGQEKMNELQTISNQSERSSVATMIVTAALSSYQGNKL